MSKAALSEADLQWVARVLFNVNGDLGGNGVYCGYEPLFSNRPSVAHPGSWEVIDAEGDPINNSFGTEMDAIQCASALNRLADHW